MAALTQNTPFPVRMTTATKDTLQIGSIIIKQPSESVWKVVIKIFKQLRLVLVDITYTTNTKFYNGVIRWKARYAVKEAKYTRETVDTTKDVNKFMYHADNLKDKMAFSKIRKEIVQSSLKKANRRITALRSKVQNIKSKLNNRTSNKIKPPLPVTIEISNNMNGTNYYVPEPIPQPNRALFQ